MVAASEKPSRKPGPKSTFDSLREARELAPAWVSAEVEPVASVRGAGGVSHTDRSKIWWVALAFLILPAVAAVMFAAFLIATAPEEGTSFEEAAAVFIVLLVAVPVSLVALLAARIPAVVGVLALVAGVSLFVVFIGEPPSVLILGLLLLSIPLLVSGVLFLVDVAWRQWRSSPPADVGYWGHPPQGDG